MFVLPFWIENAVSHIGSHGDPYIATVQEGDRVIAVAPLAVEGRTARFLGNHEVCDYQDVATAPAKSTLAVEAILDHLNSEGICNIDLRTLKPDAIMLNAIKRIMPQKVDAGLIQDDVTFVAPLPGDWDAYLMQLNGKQRHEIRRKVRRLENHGSFTYRLVANGDDLNIATDHFIKLFRHNRKDKAHFMSDAMADYFRDLIQALAMEGMLRLYFLWLGNQPVSSVLCFDYNGTRYLYNSGYDEAYDDLSVGVLSKIFSIKAGIEMGCRHYDFLKGAEIYKKRIGGIKVPLYRLRVTL